jgi:hypothetical protein
MAQQAAGHFLAAIPRLQADGGHAAKPFTADSPLGRRLALWSNLNLPGAIFHLQKLLALTRRSVEI